MRTHRWIVPTVPMLSMTAALACLVAISDASAQGGCYGNRLQRHRSGYLYGNRPYLGGATVFFGYGGGGLYGADLYGGCGPYDFRVDFDQRRDALLRHAANTDVSFLFDAPASGPARVPAGGRAPAPASGPAPAMMMMDLESQRPLHQPAHYDGPAWDLIANGKYVEALGRFAAQTLRSPGAAEPRIGFALAAALYEDDAAAIRSMRTAVRLDPDALATFTASEPVQQRVRGLLDHFSAEPAASTGDDDAQFMTASLHILLSEPVAAMDALASAPDTAPTAPAAPAAPAGPKRRTIPGMSEPGAAAEPPARADATPDDAPAKEDAPALAAKSL